MNARIAFAASSGATACHAEKIQRALAQKAGAAFDLMTKDEAMDFQKASSFLGVRTASQASGSRA